MSLTRAEAADLLGMKEREVIVVADLDDGCLATTHDGVQTYIARDGTLYAYAGHPDNTVLPVYVPPAGDAPATDEPAPAGGQVDEDPVPDGSIDTVLAWVGDDPDRAARALAAETGKANPRSSLVTALEKARA